MLNVMMNAKSGIQNARLPGTELAKHRLHTAVAILPSGDNELAWAVRSGQAEAVKDLFLKVYRKSMSSRRKGPIPSIHGFYRSIQQDQEESRRGRQVGSHQPQVRAPQSDDPKTPYFLDVKTVEVLPITHGICALHEVIPTAASSSGFLCQAKFLLIHV